MYKEIGRKESFRLETLTQVEQKVFACKYLTPFVVLHFLRTRRGFYKVFQIYL